jgi:hypothetical protein
MLSVLSVLSTSLAPTGVTAAGGEHREMIVLLRDTPTDRERVCRANRAAILDSPHMIARMRKHLKGKRLACCCAGRRCHAQDLAEIANCGDEQLRAILREHAE